MPLLVVTRSEQGAIALEGGKRYAVPRGAVRGAWSTPRAGDLFAVGFLAGQTQGRGVEQPLTMGAIASAEVISHYGARPEADLGALVAARLG